MFMYEFEKPHGGTIKTDHLELRSESGYADGTVYTANGYAIDKDTHERLVKELTENSLAFAVLMQRMATATVPPAPAEECPIILEPCLGTSGRGGHRVLIVENDGEDASEYKWKCIRPDGTIFTCDHEGSSNHDDYISSITALPPVNITESCIGYTREGIEVLLSANISKNFPWEYRTQGESWTVASDGTYYKEENNPSDIIYVRPATLEDFQRHLNHPQA